MTNILIVEDELIIAEDIAIILKNAGFNVVSIAMDYKEAILAIENHQLDLILLDINLKGVKSGLDLAKILHEEYEIPFIFTTSYTDSDTIDEAKQYKPINYLIKPFQNEQLITAIKIADFRINNQSDFEDLESEVYYIKEDIFIKDKLKYTRVNLDNVIYLKSEGNYLEIYTDKEKPVVVRSSLLTFCEKVQHSEFIQVHRSYAVNFKYLTDFEMPYVTVGKTKIPITKKYVPLLLNKFRVI